MTIFDVRGRTVKNLINEKRFSGKSSIQWNAKDSHGQTVPSGIYFFAMNAGDFKKTNKMIDDDELVFDESDLLNKNSYTIWAN